MKAKCFRALIMWLFFFGASLVWNVWPTLRRGVLAKSAFSRLLGL